MSPVLLWPIGLLALAAVVVPLIIHLTRRTEQVPTDFAALQWLDPRPRPRRRLRFDEWPLLIARLLLIALLALLLARPALFGLDDDRARVLVAPGADAAAAQRLAGENGELRWAAPGFPETEPAASRVPLSSLIRQFDAELPAKAPLTIVVPSVLDGVDAERLRLTRKVTWHIAPGATERQSVPPSSAPVLAVRYDQAGAGGVDYLRAAASAWAPAGARTKVDVASGEGLPSSGTALVWLRAGAVPDRVRAWIENGGTALFGSTAVIAMPGAVAPLMIDSAGLPLIEGASLGQGRILRFTRPLVPAVMPDLLDPDFAGRLRVALSPSPPPPARVAADEFAPTAGVAPYPQPPREIGQWLALAIALVFFAERWLATGPRRRKA